MKHTLLLMFACAILVGAAAAVTAAVDELDRGFAAPPPEARLRVYWWWLNGNVTKEAITRDLEQMKAKEIGGALIFDADGSNQDGNAAVPAGPTFGSPEWRGLFRHALREADRLGLEISLNLQSGWNLGGPLVPPDRAAQILVHSETRLAGPGAIEKPLPRPTTKLEHGFHYRDVAVVAYPAPKHAHAPISRLAEKLVERQVGNSSPDCSMLLDDVPAREGERACAAADVLDLTGKMGKDGTLHWNAPPGDWIVLRFGCVPTGRKNSTGSAGWTGLVINYLNADDLRWYWKNVVDPLISDAGPLVAKTWRYVHTDSWECRGMNWSPGFRDEFRRRRGYDLLPYMPVLAGRIVGDRPTANRFLADYRKTIGDCIADNHYKVMEQLAARHGLGMHPEAGGPHAGPIDSLRCLAIGDIPMAEFWARSWRGRVPDEMRFFIKQPASVAHTYGRRLVAAEGFTSIGPHWQESLWDNLRPSFDRAACEGLNRTFWHTFTCSPDEMGKPGQEYFAGTHFNPNVTWWPMADAFTAYINRCQFMLQRGLFAADAVYYYGDHVPNFTQLKAADPARVLPGYDYDVATEEVVLERMQVEDGRIVLPDGMSYRVLVLPPLPCISLPALRKIEQLVEAGATVVGSKPERASGLEGDWSDLPRSGPKGASHKSDLSPLDREVQTIADRLWGADGAGRPVGWGRAIAGRTAREVLQAAGVPPDFAIAAIKPRPAVATAAVADRVSNDGGATDGRGFVPGAKLDYIHRRDGDADIYFVRNCSDRTATVNAAFRVAGKRPELWDPVTGAIRQLPEFHILPSLFWRGAGGEGVVAEKTKQTVVPLRFEPYGSMFVVFRGTDDRPITKPRPAVAPGAAAENGATDGRGFLSDVRKNFPDYEQLGRLDGPWLVSFDPRWGGPERPVVFDRLVDWTVRSEEGIKHYSGTAAYRKTFELGPEAAARGNLCLDLGAVRELARVRLNGRDLGVLWCPPWRVDISAAVRPGENHLEIEVVNLWPNRLIGDAKLPPEKRLTRTNIRAFSADSPLLPSGLLGPVKITFPIRVPDSLQ